jgi:hypothetical protein
MDKQTRAPTSTTTRPISSNRLYGPSAAGCSIMKAYTSAAAQDLAAVPPCSRVSSQNIFTVIKGRGTALSSARSWTRSCERYVFFEKGVWCHDGPCLVSRAGDEKLVRAGRREDPSQHMWKDQVARTARATRRHGPRHFARSAYTRQLPVDPALALSFHALRLPWA